MTSGYFNILQSTTIWLSGWLCCTHIDAIILFVEALNSGVHFMNEHQLSFSINITGNYSALKERLVADNKATNAADASHSSGSRIYRATIRADNK
jgi:hypothetical protein